MAKRTHRIAGVSLAMLSLTCALHSTGCTELDDGAALDAEAEQPLAGEQELLEPTLPGDQPTKGEGSSKVSSTDDLPFVDAIDAAEVFVQLLPEETPAGENVALHIVLPEPANKELQDSLVRVVGDPKNPLILFRTDALVELGQLEQSPGKQFFTTFVRLDQDALDKRIELEKQLNESKEPSQTRIVFEGRTPVAVTTGIAFDIEIFKDGGPVALGACPIQPLSTLARWEESLAITDLAVVQDPTRTNDVCHPGADNPDGVWTFKHLMAEMAVGSGLSTHDFVVDWLENWLTDDTVNGDVIPKRQLMFNRVILPWANASGISASLSPSGVLTLGGELDLDQAPFRLSAIINRIDLGETVDGPSGYGGGTTSQPTTAGELRFVFGVQNLDTCATQSFSVIFEYGVPLEGCSAVKQWAIDWTQLNDSSFAGRFTIPWRDHLETLTESVVVHGAAPTKGNQNAINQIRTNENALNFQWEFREFTLTDEDPIAGTDIPSDGPLRPHTVAMTPDDTEYDDFSDARIDDFVLTEPSIGGPGVVLSTVPTAISTAPSSLGTVLTNCSASYSVPFSFDGDEFRGGNSFTASPTHWRVDAVDPADLREVCAREQFSLNTCNGCHFSDTDTFFFHVNPTTSPAALSGFMTGGGTTGTDKLTVTDAQFNNVFAMEFQDLHRRFERLYDVACAQCGISIGVSPDIFEVMIDIVGVVPVDIVGGIKPPFQVGPIHDLDVVKELVHHRHELVNKDTKQDVELGKLVRPAQVFVH